MNGRVWTRPASQRSERFVKSEVVEAIIQTAPYTGFPPALNALGALSAALGPEL